LFIKSFMVISLTIVKNTETVFEVVIVIHKALKCA